LLVDLWFFLGTFGSIQMGAIKERFADERIAENEAETARALESAAQAAQRASEADAQAARANARALEAGLELARFKAPRELTTPQQSELSRALSSFVGQKYTAVIVPAGFDVGVFWQSLDVALSGASWSRVPPAGLAVGNPPAGVSVGHEIGITVGLMPEAPAATLAAAKALIDALAEAGHAAKQTATTDHKEKRTDVITLRIGIKPQ
jgi:hypothetical protein